MLNRRPLPCQGSALPLSYAPIARRHANPRLRFLSTISGTSGGGYLGGFVSCDWDAELSDFFAEGIAIEAQDVSREGLISVGLFQHERDQRPLDRLDQYGVQISRGAILDILKKIAQLTLHIVFQTESVAVRHRSPAVAHDADHTGSPMECGTGTGNDQGAGWVDEPMEFGQIVRMPALGLEEDGVEIGFTDGSGCCGEIPDRGNGSRLYFRFDLRLQIRIGAQQHTECGRTYGHGITAQKKRRDYGVRGHHCQRTFGPQNNFIDVAAHRIGNITAFALIFFATGSQSVFIVVAQMTRFHPFEASDHY